MGRGAGEKAEIPFRQGFEFASSFGASRLLLSAIVEYGSEPRRDAGCLQLGRLSAEGLRWGTSNLH